MNYKEKGNEENNPIYNCTKRIKYLRINLTLQRKDLYSENYKKLTKDIEGDRNNWKDTPCS